ncbi:class F sortase [Gleimia sp. 6138-11-ORH1]|uniref:class F sortase n=1 Tax=Gleimia sp. 6138-11-ORH1 TaxID=2973937 RepID=UPI002169C675|nr:class F sortase [Gleimia sp. 6138-11-ORH1]MCS4484114.1 class F sortase [Gleimia sp. 6138-11-ORH1]
MKENKPPVEAETKVTLTNKKILLILGILATVVALVWGGSILFLKRQNISLRFPPAEAFDPAAYARLHPTKDDPNSVTARAKSLGCNLSPKPLGTPVSFEVDRGELKLPMLSLGLDETGSAPAAPPLSQTHTIGWYNQGPQIGASQGKAVLTGHTYSDTVGIGNQLLEGIVKPGDIIKITDEEGANACYRYRDQVRIEVATYNPDSDLVYDNAGKPQIAIVVCDNFSAATNEWLVREVFYGDLLTKTNLETFDK